MDVNQIRLIIFLGVFILMLALERFLRLHPLVDSKPRRLGINLGITGVDIIVMRLVFGAAAVGAAQFTQERGWGVLNYWDLPSGVELLITVVFLDLMIYIQHALLHLKTIFFETWKKDKQISMN